MSRFNKRTSEVMPALSGVRYTFCVTAWLQTRVRTLGILSDKMGNARIGRKRERKPSVSGHL